MMYYRRKLILALLEVFNGQLEKIQLQKLLFLLTRQQSQPAYDFIPYKFGCYSHSANADLNVMIQKGLLTQDSKRYKKVDAVNKYGLELKKSDQELVKDLNDRYQHTSVNELIKFTYKTYPYWAIHSEIVASVLQKRELQVIEQCKPKGDEITLFTIGYQGISLEEYLNRLIKNDVKMLIDVRRNPLSLKFGFSKNLLKKYCEGLSIQYVHFPEVGIASEQRQVLKSQEDYDNLFHIYQKENLSQTIPSQVKILELLERNERVALTCFEANICQCHRKYLAESIQNLRGFHYKIQHI